MKDDSQASTSIWMATAETPSPSRLKESIRTDVCIIGAGIAGLTTGLTGVEKVARPKHIELILEVAL